MVVFTGTFRPFSETEVSSTVSGSDLRGLARDDLTFPNAFVPAFNTTFPLTATSRASFASKLLRNASREVIRLTVLTLSIFPAGIVAAFADEAATQAQIAPITAMVLLRIKWFE